MYKEKYERVQLDIFEFQTEDVIMTSSLDPDVEEGELPIRGIR